MGATLEGVVLTMPFNIQNHNILFWLGVVGIVFYVISPIVFPHVENIRQPELLPVYTLMLGLGQLLKGNAEETIDEKNKQ